MALLAYRAEALARLRRWLAAAFVIVVCVLAAGGVAYAAVTVTGITPNRGASGGFTAVVITGTDFTGATAVSIGGSAVMSFTVDSSTQITALTGVHITAPPVDVTVTTPSGTGTGVVLYTYDNGDPARPTITSLNPPSASANGGTVLTATGYSFTGITSIAFAGTPSATFTVVSDTQLLIVTPARTSAASVAIQMNGPAGAGTYPFTYTAGTPVVTNATPNTQSTAGGGSVVIAGGHFTGATAVTFGGTAATSFTVNSLTQITATAPAHAAGAVDIVVTGPGGSGTGSGIFTYSGSAPTITTVAPTSGTTAGGTSVVITGTNLTGTTTVSFGGTAATGFTVNSATQITAVAPAHAAGATDVVVVAPAGTATATNAFTFLAPGVTGISGVTPNSGPAAGGTSVTITGVNLTGATAVTFGGAAAASFTVNSATQITATAPAHAMGAVDVVVVAPAGTATATGAFTYTTVPNDSQRLHDVQTVLTRLAAQASGATISAAVGTAIGEGFTDDVPIVTQTGNALRFSYAGEKPARVDEAFSAMAKATNLATKTPKRPSASDWRFWGQVGGTTWNSTVSAGDVTGGQVTGLAGVTRRLSPSLLVGVMSGYESYDYKMRSLDGALRGGGWTAGGYLGWKVLPALRLDGSLSRTNVDYKASAGTANGTIPAVRWLGTLALTGQARAGAFKLEPSASAYILNERQEAYTDSLGTLQAERKFNAGRASAGGEAIYPMQWRSVAFEPYVGLYGDYYFSGDTALVTGIASQAVITGWSGRVVAGLGTLIDGKRMMLESELGGLGSEHLALTLRGRLSVPLH